MAPGMVMQGYTVMVQELLDQLPADGPPSHVFVPGGVGGVPAQDGTRPGLGASALPQARLGRVVFWLLFPGNGVTGW